MQRYFDIAIQKDVPLETAAKFIASVVGVFFVFLEDSPEYPDTPEALENLKDIIAIIIRFIN